MPIVIENARLLCNSCGIDLGSVRPDVKVTQFLYCNNCDKARKFHSEHAFLQTWDEGIFLEAFADFTLEACDGGIVRAHKAVLAGKSKVFKTMLMAGMSECVTGRVKISDMTAEELHSLIDFLYRGTVNKKSLECHGVALYRASVKYDLPLLTAKCEWFLENNVFTDVRGVFQLATDYGVEKFQKAVLPFIFSLGFVRSNCPAVVMKTLRVASNFECFAAYRKKNCKEVPLILETAFYLVADYCDNLYKGEEERNVVSEEGESVVEVEEEEINILSSLGFDCTL